jgi:hypothetical protein
MRTEIMTNNVLHSDLSRFAPISAEVVTLSYLGTTRQFMVPSKLKSNLSAVVAPDSFDAALASLIASGKIVVEKTVKLTKAGADEAKRVLGRDAGGKWKKAWKRLPLMVLGLNPDDAITRRKFAKADSLTAGAIAISFALPSENMSSKNAVCSELIWRVLKQAAPEVVGKGPFPVIDKLGTVDRVILAGIANVSARTLPDAVNGLTAAAVGLEKVNTDALRRRLICIGIERANDTKLLAPYTKSPTPGDSGFADRVKEVAASLSTPPFQGRVAIAQVYDAYGKVNPDAGSLASFKERLVQAAKARQLDLGRLELPERMDRDLRLRSVAAWGSDEVHFVVTAWK